MTSSAQARLDRRAFVTGLLSAPLATASVAPARAAEPALRPPLRRLATLDYGIAETLISIGQPPVGLVAPNDWQDWVIEPPLPPDVINIGSNREPNLELLAQMQLDAILITGYSAGIAHRLRQIAPVFEFSLYVPEGRPLALAIRMVERLGELTGRQAEAKAFLAEMDDTFAQARDRLAAVRHRPLYMLSFLDNRHVRVYGANSLFDDVLQRLDIPNAYQGASNSWGFANLGIEELKPDPDGSLIYFEPVPPDLLASISRNPIWNSLPVVKAGRVARLPGLLIFGAVPAAMRFARQLALHLGPEGRARG
ncbi:ABC transporter substrate-binding protein [Azorhizobium oxalatiphilum]|uniref:ABC transporter substrate-binding protein n=1 Tax=Azorhizobium oxalatiphilum TaxID=980631 RepID=A0A917FDC7_9HYPH|nr:ABC transporter substrate-binding protein [Azorhizobium oxalatiphilum]GGF70392.1 ABC transporter substrate-binding protein [Azorhizobium oxalatiphilum]